MIYLAGECTDTMPGSKPGPDIVCRKAGSQNSTGARAMQQAN
jgi:hypothetical protein